MKKEHLTNKKYGGSVDWEGIKERLAAAGRAIERGWEPTPDDRRRVLMERAKELARETAETEEAGESVEVVEFLVAYENYGIESSYVREVYPVKDITPLPGTPSFIRGIVNVRGRIISVVDIKKFFDLPEKGLGEFNKLIILGAEAMEFGILADAISGVRKIFVRELQPSLPTMTGIREEYLLGVTGDRLAVLRAGKILHDKNIIVDERA